MTASAIVAGQRAGRRTPGLSMREAVLGKVFAGFGPWVPLRRVRPIREEDLAAVSAALSAAPYRSHTDDLDWQCTGAITDLIAWQGTAPVGSGFIHWSGPRDAAVAELVPGCPEIFRLEVLASHRSKGIGAALVRALEALARARGFDQVGLGVGTANHRARALYERLGYRVVSDSAYVDRSEYPDAHGQRCTAEEPCVFMVKDLGSATPGSSVLRLAA